MAAEPLSFEAISGSSVFVDTSHLGDRVDRDYVVLRVRHTLAKYAIHVLPQPEGSQFVVVLGIGVTGTDRQETLIGIPSTPVGGFPGMPLAFTTPEIALYKRVQQQGMCRITATVVQTATGQLVDDIDTGIVMAEKDMRWHLGFGPKEY